MYLEHQKQIEKKIESELNQTLSIFINDTASIGKFVFRFHKFYSLTFPENSYSEMNEFNSKAKATYFERNCKIYEEELKGLLNLAATKSIKLSELYERLVSPLFDTGFTISPTSTLNNENTFLLIKEALQGMPFILTILMDYELIKQDTYSRCLDLHKGLLKVIDT